MKVIRISYANDNNDDQNDGDQEEELNSNKHVSSQIMVNVKCFGLSLINSQARELAYIFFRNIKFSHGS